MEFIVFYSTDNNNDMYSSKRRNKPKRKYSILNEIQNEFMTKRKNNNMKEKRANKFQQITRMALERTVLKCEVEKIRADAKKYFALCQ